jgi:hypothetical protein
MIFNKEEINENCRKMTHMGMLVRGFTVQCFIHTGISNAVLPLLFHILLLLMWFV